MAYQDNQSRDDARARVTQARIGSLANEPTEEYLLALRADLYEWIGEIERTIYDRAEAQRPSVAAYERWRSSLR